MKLGRAALQGPRRLAIMPPSDAAHDCWGGNPLSWQSSRQLTRSTLLATTILMAFSMVLYMSTSCIQISPKLSKVSLRVTSYTASQSMD